MIEWEKKETGECETLKDMPKDACAVTIEDKTVVARCESCRKYIVEGEFYHVWQDGVSTCEECGGPEGDDV